MIGKLNINPITGTRERNAIVAGMNPRNNNRNPYDSNNIPIMGQPSRTIIIPVKNEADAFHLCR